MLSENAGSIMRRCGYRPWRDPMTGEDSYTRRLNAAFYPRFHVHVTYDGNLIPTVGLHLDWRRPMHKLGQRSFEDEESETVQTEAARIKAILDAIS